MNFDKRHVAVLALTGCAVALSAYISRRRSLKVKAEDLQTALEVWEKEGGIVPSSPAQPADARLGISKNY